MTMGTTETVTLRQHLSGSAEDVFAALTDASALQVWLAEYAAVDLSEGRYEFWGRYTPDGARGRQELLEAAQPKRLRFGWVIGTADTEVDIQLEPREDGTEITLVHSGLPKRRGAEAYVGDLWWLALDNLADYVAGRAPAPRYDFTEQRADVHAEIEIEAPAREIYRALIEPDRLDRWIGTGAKVDPVVGGEYSFGWDEGPVKLLDLVEDEVVEYSWREPDSGNVVRWQLDGSGGRTHITLVHSGFGGRDTSGYQLGWQAFLSTLRRMLELGDGWRKIEQLS
jgi:uncharacterized protein YndB with AHSA1/START domain